MIVVSNATSLIALTAVGSLDLLANLFGEVHVPDAVYEEVVIAGAGKAGAEAVAQAAWVVRRSVTNRSAVSALMTNSSLDVGESEAIVLAQELKADFVLLDDRAARRAAQRLNLNVIGTVGILLLSKYEGHLQTVRPLLDALLRAGIYLDVSLYQSALMLAGE
jgi:predicted nucleic acid-binding protein